MNSNSINTILDAVQGFQKQRGGGGGDKSSRDSKESSRGPGLIGELDDKLEDIEERCKVIEACNRNSRCFKPYHRLERIKVLMREDGKKGATVYKWVGHPEFPKTVMAFKMLQNNPRRVRNLMEFYNIIAYCDDEDDPEREPRRVDLAPADKFRDVADYMDSCLESLAIAFGIDWGRIGGLTIPGRQHGGGRSGGPPGGISGNGGGGGGGGGGPPRSRPQSGVREDLPDPRDRGGDRDRDRDRDRGDRDRDR